jgi:glucose dehydrogenase
MLTVLHLTKYLVVFAALVAIIGLSACTSAPKQSTTPPPTTNSPTTTPTPTPTLTPSSIPVPTTTKPTTTSPTPEPTPTQQANPVPPEVAQYAADWPLPNKDYANTRTTKDSTINSSNINSLGVVWAFPIPGTGGSGSVSTMPIVMGNTVYMQDMTRNIFAIDRTTGKAKWTHMYNDNDVGPNGVSVGYGKVFFASNAYTMTALDANTGNEVWKNKLSSTNTIGIDIQPTVYNGTVYTSTVPAAVPGVNNFYRGNAYGSFFGLDQATGKSLWKWDTVDDPKTMWGHPEVNSGGGTWYPPAIDTQTGMSYWGVALPRERPIS